MATPAPCPACNCCRASADAIATHALQAALFDDDLDRAIDLGLLTCQGCASCTIACTIALFAARDARLRALAARKRYLARNARLQHQSGELAAKRASARSPVDTSSPSVSPRLPPAAAAALARAKARAVIDSK